jgi:hypothetical protein
VTDWRVVRAILGSCSQRSGIGTASSPGIASMTITATAIDESALRIKRTGCPETLDPAVDGTYIENKANWKPHE